MIALWLCAAITASDARPTVALMPPVPAGRTEAWIGATIVDNLNTRLLFHSRFDPKTVSRVYPLNVFGWRQVLSAARAEGLQVSKSLSSAAARRLQAQLGADHVFLATYRTSGAKVTLKWWLTGKDKKKTRVLALSNLADGTDALASEILEALGQSADGLGGHTVAALPLAAAKPYGQALLLLSRQSLDPRAHLVLPRKEVEHASSLLRATTEADPSFVRGWVMRAVCDAMLGEMEKAEESLVKAMSTAGEFDPTVALGLYYVYDRSGEHDEAVKVLAEAADTHLGFLHALGYLGQAYLRTNRSHDALRVFSSYTTRVPKSPWARIKRGEALARTGKHDLAIEETRKVVGAHPRSNTALTALATRQIDARHLKEARATLKSLLERLPDHPAVLARLASVELEEGNTKKGLGHARKAVAAIGDGRGEPLAGYAHVTLGHALALLGKRDAAIAALKKAQELGIDADDVLMLKRDNKLGDFLRDPRNPLAVKHVHDHEHHE